MEYALERRGMKVSGSKTEHMCINGREGSRNSAVTRSRHGVGG